MRVLPIGWFVGPAVSLACYSAWADEPVVADGDRQELATAFRESCLHCHQPPDPQFETDRAWLEQVRETA